MKVAIVNLTKPVSGTGDGMTEYTFQLVKNMKMIKGVEVVSFYALEETRRRNVVGLVAAQPILGGKVNAIVKGNFDIVHITNQEAGFVARMLKRKGCKAKILTTVHDTMRLRTDLHRGIKQGAYNHMVRGHIRDAVDYSDELLFDEPKTVAELKRFRSFGRYKVVFLGVDERFLGKVKNSHEGESFVVGYLGSFAHNKNVGFILRTAKLLRKEKGIKFSIYGSGGEIDALKAYKNDNELSNVDFMGFAPEVRKREIYDSFDAFVFPTLGEDFSLPILEAMASGSVVIIPKSSELVGFQRKHCMEANNEKGLASLLIRLKERGPNKSFIRKAAEFARSLTWKETAKNTLAEYKGLLS
ncbi:MAG: glycosyltransferase family 4 protein [Candidatus Micrarchaeota archaeon]|nr:glycosyltransferase family 4 protein [Candidatus Micrarchaeota archaeon]